MATILIVAGADSLDLRAQQVQPTAEQMRMINSLPPAQRQQALEALGRERTSSQSRQTTLAEPLTEVPTDKEQVARATASARPDVQRVESGSHIILEIAPRPTLTPDEMIEIEEDVVLAGISGSRHYEIDQNGVLTLPGLGDIELLGLTQEAVAQRLRAVPELEDFNVIVTLLDTESIGADALLPFGYDVFEPGEVGFQPVTSGPVPPDYILGPGDSIRVQLFGNVNGIYEFEVSRDGVLSLPQLGPITVAGLPFSEFRTDLNNRVREMLIGTQVSVTMGALRTIRVFVLGDVNRPGSYVLSSMSTISSALYQSGGISEIGTLRNIQLKRRGDTVATLDLYDLLLNGDTSGDQRLQPSDVIFVPPIGGATGVAGAVRRPAIYELRGESSVAEVVALAGGLRSDAFPGGARLERINGSRDRIVLSVNLDSDNESGLPVTDGDILFVPQVLPDFRESVTLEGFAQRPGRYQWRPGMRLTDLITSPLELRPGADANYILVRRENRFNRSVSVISADLKAALGDPLSDRNIALEPRDTVFVFDLAFGRQRVISPVIEELRLQARLGDPFNQVQVAGEVRAPGDYPLEPGMQISDLIRAGGSLAEQAFALEAELTRFAVVEGEYRAKEVIDVDLQSVLAGNSASDLVLEPHDHLRIDLLPDWNTDWSVTLDGEVRFPGEYPILKGETITQLLTRAGGLTDQAFPEGAIFLRESLREREREQMDILARRMESDLATMSLENIDTTGAEALSIGQSLLDQLRNTEPVGRLVIDTEMLAQRVETENLVRDIELRDGDRLLVPIRSQEVTVLGEVQHPTSHIFQPGLARDEYISLSGGLTRKADKKLIYVVRASGAVVSSGGSGWFGRGGETDIRPGDTIVSPIETDRIRPLTFWTNVTQILYQGAIAVAAVKTFSN